MEFVSSLHSTMPSLPTQDVLLGIGTTKFVSLVLKDGSSMLTTSVLQCLTNVKTMMQMDSAPHATKDTI